jgi:hypothetical protein
VILLLTIHLKLTWAAERSFGSARRGRTTAAVLAPFIEGFIEPKNRLERREFNRISDVATIGKNP